MLRTDERALLVDLLIPEPGFRLERAVGTTFTLQLESLLRVPLAVAGLELRETSDPLGVMEAVRASADRVDLFCQAGMVRVPAQHNPLLAFLEPIVHQVRRPYPGRLFHPKVWAASFTNESGERRFKLVCGSRNLTSDRTWDIVVGLDGVDTGSHRSVNEPLSDFIASLPGRCAIGVDYDRRDGVLDLASSLSQAEWTSPPVITGNPPDGEWLEFHWLDSGRSNTIDFADATKRLIISPFINTDGLESVWPDGEATVISRADSFESLGEENLTQLREWTSELYVLDDRAALPEEQDVEAGLRWSLSGLHAKVFQLDRGRRSHLILGSPNATSSAFSGNTEFAVELIGSRQRIGTRATLSGSAGALTDVLAPFHGEPTDRVESDELQRKLEQALIEVASIPMTTTAVAATRDSGLWDLRLASQDAVPSALPVDSELSVRLLSDDRWCALESGAEVAHSWESLDAEEVTPFVEVALTPNPGAGVSRVSCVVLTRLIGGPEDRLDRAIAKQVATPDAFIHFLLLILNLAEGDTVEIGEHMAGTSSTRSGAMASSGAGILESLVVALADNPRTIDRVADLVDRLVSTSEGRSVLPEGWDVLWPNVVDARQALEVRR
ncbi:MAG: phospholipase D family protein [Microthrixaceae bacterium]